MQTYYLVNIDRERRGIAGFFGGAMVSVKRELPDLVIVDYEFESPEDYGARGGSMSNAYLSAKGPRVKTVKDMVDVARSEFGWKNGKVRVSLTPPQSRYRNERFKGKVRVPIPAGMNIDTEKRESWMY